MNSIFDRHVCDEATKKYIQAHIDQGFDVHFETSRYGIKSFYFTTSDERRARLNAEEEAKKRRPVTRALPPPEHIPEPEKMVEPPALSEQISKFFDEDQIDY